MDIGAIRGCITRGAYFVTDHALTEGFKDGITVSNMVGAIRTGKIIEQYRERHRCLIFGRRADGIPIHVVVDFGARETVDIVTTYIPQKSEWINSQVRKKRKR